MKPETKEWLAIAEGDYQVGLYAYKKAHHPQAIYMLCQALEKVLKAAQIEFADQAPKRTHRLEQIAKDSWLEFSQEQYDILTDLSKHYAKVRYPDFARMDYNTKSKVSPIVTHIKDLYQWTLHKFNNH